MNKKRIINIIIGLGLFSVPVLYYSDRWIPFLNDPVALLEAVFSNLVRMAGWSGFSIVDVLLPLGVTLICLIAEVFILGWRNSSLFRLVHPGHSEKGDLWCFILTTSQLFRLFYILMTFGVIYVLNSLISNSEGFGLLTYIKHPGLQFALLFILIDFKTYLRHYFAHQWRWFWELHKYHHSAKRLNMITTQRGHLVEGAVISIVDAGFFFLLGAPLEYFWYFILLREMHQMFIHSEVAWSWGWIGRNVLISPKAHHIHHSTAPEHFNKNMGNFFVWWDKIFGTWYAPNQVMGRLSFGVEDEEYDRNGFWATMFLTYRRSIDQLKNVFTKN